MSSKTSTVHVPTGLVSIVLALVTLVVGRATADDAVRSAPEPATVVRDAIDVRRAELLVWVDARDGTPVRGLAADDFELSIDGEPWPILDVRAVALDAPTTRSSAASREPTTVLFVVDPTFLLPGDLHGVRESLGGFIERALRPGDLSLLAVPGPRLEVPVRATDDPGLVARTLERIEVGPLGGRFEREREAVEREIRRGSRRADQSQQALLQIAQLNRSVLTVIDGFRAEARDAAERLSRQLDALLEALAGVPGRKQMIYVGGRLPTVTAAELYQSWRTTFGGRAGGLPGNLASLSSDRSGFDDLGVAGDAIGDEDLFEGLARRAAAAGITVHTVNAAALRGTGAVFGRSDSPSAVGSAPRVAAADARRGDAPAMGLRLLAEGSGGRALGSNRRFDDLMGRIAGDLETHYVLAFEPPAEGDRTGAYALDVDLRRAAAPRRSTVRHRALAVPESPDLAMARRTLSALLLARAGPARAGPRLADARATAPVLPVPAGMSAFDDLELVTGEAADGALPATLRVPLGRLALRPDGAVHAGHLTVYATAGSFTAGTAPLQTARVPVRLPNQDLLTSLGRRAELRLDIPLPPGAERVAVTVRDDFGDRLGTLVVPIGSSEATPLDQTPLDQTPLETVAPDPLPDDDLL